MRNETAQGVGRTVAVVLGLLALPLVAMGVAAALGRGSGGDGGSAVVMGLAGGGALVVAALLFQDRLYRGVGRVAALGGLGIVAAVVLVVTYQEHLPIGR